MPLIYMDDLRLNAVVDGPANAPPLVLIHALGTDLSIWDGVVARLPRHRILRLDLRGHGQSDCPPPPYAMGALIRDVERLMAHVGMAEAVVVGVSLGGLVAAAVAPLAAAFFGLVDIVIPLVACSLIVFWKHRENIQRLMAGTEPRIGQK